MAIITECTHVLDIVLPHDFNQVDGPQNVVGVVQHWEIHALPNSLTARKVNDGLKPAHNNRDKKTVRIQLGRLIFSPLKCTF